MFKSCVNLVGKLVTYCVGIIVWLFGCFTSYKNCAQNTSYTNVFTIYTHNKSPQNLSYLLLKKATFTQHPQGLLKLLLL